MAKPSIETLQAEIEGLKALVQRLGGFQAKPIPETDRADYIEFGSPEHAAFLGLVRVEGEADGRITHTSLATGDTWALEDEVTPFMQYPDPKQVAVLVLRQKVSELEAGRPGVYDGAPDLWMPRDLGYG